ncbi:MAG: serine hydrolase domain-containing protein, partial [Stackebrandtia sp.]
MLAGSLIAGSLSILCWGAFAPPAAASETGPSTATAREFADEYIPEQLERHRIPGAAITVVSGNKRVFAKGYGVADVADDRAVDAGKTLFAPASVAKLLTATAVMQLAEAGRIDLDTDVNEYLKRFQVEDTFPGRPITMSHLLTHTAGFAVHDSGTGARAGDIHPLGAHLARNLPERIRPPGERAVYSNYGMALAGHVVEEVSGMPFHEYIDAKILKPLGMSRT